MTKTCRVITDVNGYPFRIVKSRKHYMKSPVVMSRKEAVSLIRQKVFELSKGQCYYCGKIINKNFHMHERLARGKGGEISIINSVASCASCHIGPDGEHGKRRPRFGESQG